MSEIQFDALLPYTLLAASSMVVILLIAFRLSHTVIQVAGFLLLCLVIAALWNVRSILPVSILPLFQIDGFALVVYRSDHFLCADHRTVFLYLF